MGTNPLCDMNEGGSWVPGQRQTGGAGGRCRGSRTNTSCHQTTLCGRTLKTLRILKLL